MGSLNQAPMGYPIFPALVTTMRPFLIFLLAGIPAMAACENGKDEFKAPIPSVALGGQALERTLSLSPLGDPPPDTSNRVADDPAAAAFGEELFFTKDLSPTGTIACATCHDPEQGWSDGKSLSVGLDELSRNSPTLWNAAYSRWYFWDGRADSLWAQALQPLEHPKEMGSDRLFVAHAIGRSPTWTEAYESLFGALPPLDNPDRFPPQGRPIPDDPSHTHHRAWTDMREEDREAVTEVFVNVGKAIAAFERTVITGRAPFDVFVEGLREDDPGKLAALSPSALRGLRIFVGQGECIICHTGPNFSDNEFHNLGLAKPVTDPNDRFAGVEAVRADPFNARGAYSDDTEGRTARHVRFVRQNEEQLGQYKTPTLRNITETAPYMHDGRFATLEDVVRFYSDLPGEPPVGHREDFMRPLNLSSIQIRDLVAFLETLTEIEKDPKIADGTPEATREVNTVEP